MSATNEMTAGGEGAVGVRPMTEVDAALHSAVAAAVTTEGMMRAAVRTRVAPATGTVAMSPLQISMERRW